MSGLAHWLVLSVLHAPVIDAIGIEGEYDYDLSFAPEPAPLPKGSVVFAPPSPVAGVAAGLASPATPADRPTIFTAIKQQLGLQLEAIKSVLAEVLYSAG